MKTIFAVYARHQDDVDFPEIFEEAFANNDLAQRYRTKMNAGAIAIGSPFRYFVNETEVYETDDELSALLDVV